MEMRSDRCPPRVQRLAGIFLALLLLTSLSRERPAWGGELEEDEHVVLLLHFNDSLTTASGADPITAEGTVYEQGIFGSGYRVNLNSTLEYAMPESFDPSQGTAELWIKPQWIGVEPVIDNSMHIFYINGIKWVPDCVRAHVNPGPFLKFLMLIDDSEAWRGVDLQSWDNDQWHHLAVTWEIPGEMKIYIDGVEEAFNPASEQDLLPTQPVSFHIGSLDPQQNIRAVVDEFRLSNRARSPQEIAATVMAADFDVTSMVTDLDSVRLFPGWTHTLGIDAQTSLGMLGFPNSVARWSVDDPSVATVDASGTITGLSTGTTEVTAAFGDLTVRSQVVVDPIVLDPEETVIDGFLAAPAEGHLYEIPVVVLQYIPTPDGVLVEQSPGELETTVEDLRTRLEMLTRRAKFMLEEGSRFRGYKNPDAIPSIGYRVIKVLTFYEHMPVSRNPCGWNTRNHYPDYEKVFQRIGAEQLVNEQGVKQFWIWYRGFEINGIGHELPESNMSSPVTGDISNSERRDDDLPVYEKTYCVYQYGWDRLHCEAIHNHGHQLESMLGYANQMQDGNTEIFVSAFMGIDETGTWQPGRAGTTHHGSNAMSHYDYANERYVWSDIEDWRPDNSGEKTQVNVDTWRSIPYQWPEEPDWFPPDSPYALDFSRAEAQWYIYWMQNMPGHDNHIRYAYRGSDEKGGLEVEREMCNWWLFTADWDSTTTAGGGLYNEIHATSVAADPRARPDEYALHQNWPNPFNPTTTISYDLPGSAHVTVSVYNAAGQLVARLVDAKQDAGTHAVDWDAEGAGSGLYFYRLESGGVDLARPMVLVK